MAAPSDTKKGYTFGYSSATTSSHASRTIHTDAAFLLPHLKPHHTLLDIGCGPGTITLGFAALLDPSQGASITGIDIGAPVLETARQRAADQQQQPKLQEPFVSFKQANVLEGLPFEDDTFDVVFTSQTLIHLAPAPDAPVTALKEIRRVLKPGGVLAARDAASITYHPFTAELQREYTERMFRVIGTDGPCGVHMPKYLRLAGWDVDKGTTEGTIRIGGGSMVVAGRGKVLWWRDTMGGRLAKGDSFRENWLKAGVTEEECDATKALMDRWAESEDAWYGVLQSEVLAWK